MTNGKRYPVTIALAAVNILIFLICELTGSTENSEVLYRSGAFLTSSISAGEYYRLVTAMFLHQGIRHLLNNMLLLVVLGSTLEICAGRWRYLLICLGGGLCGNIATWYVYVIEEKEVLMTGASGCVYAVMGALLYVIIRNGGRVRDLSLRQMLILVGFSIYFSVTDANAANMTHLFSLDFGFLLAGLVYRPRKPENEGGNTDE